MNGKSKHALPGVVSRDDLERTLRSAGLVTVDEAAELTGVMRGTISSWANDEHIYGPKVGRYRYVSPAEIRIRAKGLPERSAATAKMRAALASSRSRKASTPPVSSPAPAPSTIDTSIWHDVKRTLDAHQPPAGTPALTREEIRGLVKDAVRELFVEIGLVAR